MLLELFGPFFHHNGSLSHDKLSELPLSCNLTLSNVVKFSNMYDLVPPIKEGYLDTDEYECMENTLKVCFGTAYKRILIVYKYSSAIQYNGELYRSLNSVHSNSSLMLVKHGDNFNPAFVLKYIKIAAIIALPGCSDDQNINIYMSAVSWLKDHPNRNWFGQPIEVWRKFSEGRYPDTFVSVSNIVCRCAHLTEDIEFHYGYKETVTTVIPLHNYFGLY